MYKQTIPIPTLPTNESACFTAACSALFSVFVSFAYPTCSLYPLASYSFPSVLVACPLLLPLVSHWSIPCCPTPSLLTMLTKTFSPQCFPYFSRGLRCHKFFPFYFISKLVFDPSSCFLAPPTQKVRRVFVGTHLSADSHSRFLNFSLCTYIPTINLPLDTAFLFPLFLFFFFLPLVYSANRPVLLSAFKTATEQALYSISADRVPTATI